MIHMSTHFLSLPPVGIGIGTDILTTDLSSAYLVQMYFRMKSHNGKIAMEMVTETIQMEKMLTGTKTILLNGKILMVTGMETTALEQTEMLVQMNGEILQTQ